MRNSTVDKLNKKQKFIIMTVLGSLVIFVTFIWSMIINLGQISISNPIPEVILPELSELESQQVGKEEYTDNQIKTETKDESNTDNQNSLEQELDLNKIIKQ